MAGIIVTNRKRAVLSRRSVLNVGGAPCCCEPEVPGDCDCDPNGTIFRTALQGCPLDSPSGLGPPTRLVRVELTTAMFYAAAISSALVPTQPAFLLEQRASIYQSLSACVTSRGIVFALPVLYAANFQQRSNQLIYNGDDENIERGFYGATIESDGSVGPDRVGVLPDFTPPHSVIDRTQPLQGVVPWYNFSTLERYPGNEPGQFGGYPSFASPCAYMGDRSTTRPNRFGGPVAEYAQTLGYNYVDDAASGGLTLSATETFRQGPNYSWSRSWITSINWRRTFSLCTGGTDSLTLGPRGCSDCGDPSRIVIE